jgi:hypothetical protein
MDAGIVKSNPFARSGAFKEDAKGNYIPVHEFWEIYKYLPDYMKPVALVAYFTGMRKGEIIELEWDRVNISEGYLDLTPDDTKTDEPAVEAVKRFDVSGIGFVFSKDDNLFGVDLDNCIQNGSLRPEAARIVNALATYTEISPSGNGVKLFAKGRLPGPNKNSQLIEAYDHARYFTVKDACALDASIPPLP